MLIECILLIISKASLEEFLWGLRCRQSKVKDQDDQNSSGFLSVFCVDLSCKKTQLTIFVLMPLFLLLFVPALEKKRFDLAIIDLNSAGWVSGLDLLQEMQRRCPGTQVIICSAHEKKAAIEVASKLGASKFIEKPVNNVDRLLLIVRETLAQTTGDKAV